MARPGTAGTRLCARCSRSIPSDELEAGLTVETDKGLFCPECARYALGLVTPAAAAHKNAVVSAPAVDPQQPQEEPPPASAEAKEEDDPVLLLRGILNELRPIARTILYEKASVWNILGGVGQIFSLALLLVAILRWDAGSEKLLLLAVLAQLLTLTCFVRGK